MFSKSSRALIDIENEKKKLLYKRDSNTKEQRILNEKLTCSIQSIQEKEKYLEKASQQIFFIENFISNVDKEIQEAKSVHKILFQKYIDNQVKLSLCQSKLKYLSDNYLEPVTQKSLFLCKNKELIENVAIYKTSKKENQLNESVVNQNLKNHLEKSLFIFHHLNNLINVTNQDMKQFNNILNNQQLLLFTQVKNNLYKYLNYLTTIFKDFFQLQLLSIEILLYLKKMQSKSKTTKTARMIYEKRKQDYDQMNQILLMKLTTFLNDILNSKSYHKATMHAKLNNFNIQFNNKYAANQKLLHLKNEIHVAPHEEESGGEREPSRELINSCESVDAPVGSDESVPTVASLNGDPTTDVAEILRQLTVARETLEASKFIFTTNRGMLYRQQFFDSQRTTLLTPGGSTAIPGTDKQPLVQNLLSELTTYASSICDLKGATRRLTVHRQALQYHVSRLSAVLLLALDCFPTEPPATDEGNSVSKLQPLYQTAAELDTRLSLLQPTAPFCSAVAELLPPLSSEPRPLPGKISSRVSSKRLSQGTMFTPQDLLRIAVTRELMDLNMKAKQRQQVGQPQQR